MWKATGVDAPADAMWRTQPHVYVYRFDWDEEPKLLWFDLGELIGAAHAFEIPFVFGHWNLGPQSRRLYDEANLPGREALSQAMMSYWAEFARRGTPGRGTRGDQPLWSAWHPEDGAEKFVVLDTPAGGGIRMASDAPITNAALVAELMGDPRLPDEQSRCALLATLVAWSPDLDESHYAAGGCDGHPVVASE
jgi:para-nitrobenzyl esterase